jgi:hypothetical protein
MSFEQFYEAHFPPDLKHYFEAWLEANMAYTFYDEKTKLAIANAFVSGATVAIARSNAERRSLLSLFTLQ